MYELPYSGKRIVFQLERNATVNTALTSWGRRRTNEFFDKSLKGESFLKCEILHPLAAIRYKIARFLIENYFIFKDKENHQVSSAPLTEAERNYVLFGRPPLSVYLAPQFRAETLKKWASRIKKEVEELV